jgi:hypothetical protein
MRQSLSVNDDGVDSSPIGALLGRRGEAQASTSARLHNGGADFAAVGRGGSVGVFASVHGAVRLGAMVAF